MRKKSKAPQSLPILEYIAICNAEERIFKNGDVLSVQDKDVSPISETNKIEELFRAISENAPKRKMGRELSICPNLKKHGREV